MFSADVGWLGRSYSVWSSRSVFCFNFKVRLLLLQRPWAACCVTVIQRAAFKLKGVGTHSTTAVMHLFDCGWFYIAFAGWSVYKELCKTIVVAASRLGLERFSSRPFVQLDLEAPSGTIFQWTSDSRTCHTAVSDSRWRYFCSVIGTKVQCAPPFTVLKKCSFLLTY